MPVIEIEELRKTYAGRHVVDGVNLTVEPGEIFGILGRNGAGKTTTVECAIGLRKPDGGRVHTFGLDPRAERARVLQSVGVQLQSAYLHMSLTVIEQVRLYRSFYRDGLDPDELLERLDLQRLRTARTDQLSGGELQRLSIATALVGKPRLAVLDELTSGLDSAARRQMWQLIEDMRDDGITIVLVSHFMEEVERLADRVAVLDAGRVVALDTPAGLVRAAGGDDAVRFRVHGPLEASLLTALPGVDDVSIEGTWVRVSGRGDLVGQVTSALMSHGIPATDFTTRTASLDDAFLQLTGHALGEPEPQPGLA
ncbi:ABC transporter ATP-binding protein [Ornithinimicrobium faecis]|uniref:ABC transporter ATP-binding protein n=1 Tax=Ornithinimicrobium faecis TaxID=2934158 RepID=A0ABY4YWQ8_9MICO|nr:ABC transporter ATP-binding protein [Ornithinimicrobium sp. HY1793]USQ81206.1 ABC transporter ATP-binding protein [Ornithinimicrobium sp. HY1793]